MSLESVLYRLNTIGLNPYAISLPEHIKRATVTRDWISTHYGGAAQGSQPPIDRTKFKHGLLFRFFDFDYNPNLPRNPGDPGLVFFGVGDASPWSPEPEHVFVRFATNVWLYIGLYRMSVAESLTAEEWTRQSSAFKSQWCRTIANGGGGENSRALCINIHLHHRLKRAPTQAETRTALKSSNDPRLTPEQIDIGFQRGQARIAVWTMKCVGYNESLQRELSKKPTGWKKDDGWVDITRL
ncbi:hypothetical protein C8J57DRAFT_1069982 [Mycena rebaudengoi]|nr:hypothetical protein C8J57DRAFT_1069982 [Mycena rebaudengoi]